MESAIAFVLRHRAVASAIIDPRTIEHLESQLAAADAVLSDAVLSDAVLDRIDEIVAPGVTLNPADNGWAARPWSRPFGAASRHRLWLWS